MYDTSTVFFLHTVHPEYGIGIHVVSAIVTGRYPESQHPINRLLDHVFSYQLVIVLASTNST